MPKVTVKTSDSTKLLARIGSQPRGIEHVYKLTTWDSNRFNDALHELVMNGFVKVEMRSGVPSVRRAMSDTEKFDSAFEKIDATATSIQALLKEKKYEWQEIQDVYNRWLCKEGKLCCTDTWCEVTAALLLLFCRKVIDCSSNKIALRVPAVEEEPLETVTTGYVEVTDASEA